MELPRYRRAWRGATAATLVLVMALPLSACGSSGGSAGGSVKVTKAWARTSPGDVENGAVYFTLTASEADALVAAAVDPKVAEMTQLHETVAAGPATTAMGGSATTMATGSSMAEAMTMREIDRLELPKGKAVELKPGGYHIMLMKLAAPLQSGSTVKIELTFEKAAKMTVDVPVQDNAP